MSTRPDDRSFEIFIQARAIQDPAKRLAFLDQQCDGLPELRSELNDLLQNDREQNVLDESLGRALDVKDEMARPERIGRYRVVELLGEGGMGVVYKAEQENPRRLVALKVMRGALLSPTAQRRFETEVTVLGRLQHPGIAQIFEAGRFEHASGSEPFFAMELVEGLDLLRYSREKVLSIHERLDLFAKVCDAVHYAHQKSVIHRDLKPGNVVVDAAGQPKILDFGIAKPTDLDGQQGMTQTGSVVGSLHQMSPEQARGNPHDIDIRTDVYSLGVILYELLTGQLPYLLPVQQPMQALRLICEKEPTPPSVLDKDLEKDVETIILKCLEKVRERRYQSAAVLVEDIHRYLRHEPILARPASTIYHLRKFSRRYWLPLSLAAAVFIASIVGIIVSLSFMFDARAQAKEVVIAKDRADLEFKEKLTVLDRLAVDGLIQEAEDLWPRRDWMEPRFREWLREAEDLLSRLEGYQATLGFLAPSGAAKGTGNATSSVPAESTGSIVDSPARSQRALFAALVAKLEQLASLKKTVGERLDYTLVIRNLTIEEHHAQWEEAVFEIAQHERYGGLEIEPQVGLVPIGADPESGLLEFWVYESGDQPQRDPQTGKLSLTDHVGTVLVLLPGGTFWMGAQDRSPDEPNYDPTRSASYPIPHEIQEIQLSPFLISKYELTQWQWEQLAGKEKNQSYRKEGWHPERQPEQMVTSRHPVEQVTYKDCATVLRRYEMAIPTEAQWEYAARAETSTPYWTGTDQRSILNAGNVLDWTYSTVLPSARENLLAETWLDDGHGVHAPVGSYRANPFGLHDVIGNVAEWCADWFLSFDQPVRDGDALRSPGPGCPAPQERIRRGGGWPYPAIATRSAIRTATQHFEFAEDIGIRPARNLTPRREGS